MQEYSNMALVLTIFESPHNTLYILYLPLNNFAFLFSNALGKTQSFKKRLKNNILNNIWEKIGCVMGDLEIENFASIEVQ